jgi:hypothetical protein
MMRDYGKIRPKFWTQGTGKRLRGDPPAQVVATYLMSGPPTHMTGIFYCPLPTVSYETGIPLEGVGEALRRLSEEDFAHFDATYDLVWVPNLAREQIGTTLKPRDNIIPSLCKWLEKFGNHAFCLDFVHRYRGPYNLPPELVGRALEGPFPNGASEGPSEPLRSQRSGIRDQRAVAAAARAIGVAGAAEHGPGTNGATATTPNGSQRVTARDAAVAWQQVLDQCNPGAAHVHDLWHLEFATIATVCNAVDGKPELALRVVCEWFWTAPDGPVQSGRLTRKNATPRHLAKHISRDLDGALKWWTERKRQQESQPTTPHEAAE